jgi:oligopeptide/dipeptide ABC transporter ATP-binding protein
MTGGPSITPSAGPSSASRPSEQAALEVSGLSITLDRGREQVPLVTDVTLGIGSAEIVGLVGESGSGKSLTALACMGLLPAGISVTAGDVRLDGASILGLSRRELRKICGSKISMIFQDPLSSLDPCARIGNQIIETVLAHRDVSVAQARREAIEFLDLVRIPKAAARLRSYPHEFSGGMRQRVMIAAALVLKPQVLLADEPTTALDVTTQAGIVELVRDLRRELHMSVLWISHDLGLVGRIADRVAVMYGGEIVEVASAQQLFAEPQHPYSEGLIRSSTRGSYGQDFGFIPGSVTEPGWWPAGCRFSPRCARKTAECEAHPRIDRTETGAAVRCVHPAGRGEAR